MKRRYAIIISSFSIVLVLNSCITHKKLTYLQYMGRMDNSIIPISRTDVVVTPSNYKVSNYDNLLIRVITPDPQWSEIFNSTSNGGGSGSSESPSLLGYPVDSYGMIELPFIGKLEVAGKTLSEIKVELDLIFKNYVKDASIIVRLVNNYINIIGEVNSPGRYPLTKNRLNIFEALAMAGDLSVYSNRQKVQLIRSSPDGPIVKEFSLSDRSILTSEYYYVFPNDIIYAQPLKGRSFQVNSSTYSLILGSIGTILTSITTLIVLFGYTR